MLAHCEPVYSDSARPYHLANSERVSKQSLLLPLYPQMSDSEIASVIDALCEQPERSRLAKEQLTAEDNSQSGNSLLATELSERKAD